MIFYYSATGITAVLAHRISERIEEPALDIEMELQKDSLEYTLEPDERLGFLCPVYFGDVPQIVKDFVSRIKIHTKDSYYCFLCLTFGTDGFYAPNRLLQLLLQHGLTTSAVFGLRGIDTFLPMFQIPDGEARAQIEAKSELEASFIAEQIADRTVTTYLKNRGPFPWVTSLCMSGIYKAFFQKTRNFKVSDDCTGCGLCASKCPLQAIQIDDSTRRPVWIKDRCMTCLRCLHRCPVSAIDYGSMTQGKLRFKDKT